MARWPASRSSAATTCGLQLAAAQHRMRQRLRVAAPAGAPCCASSHSKNVAIEHQAVLDHFGQAGAQLARAAGWQARATSAITATRLVERADHVLAERVVDSGLAADRRVDLREQRGRHLDEGDAALVDRRGESGEIADHAAAQARSTTVCRSQRASSIAPTIASSVCQRLACSPSSTSDFDTRARRLAQRGAQLLEIKRRHHCIGDDCRTASAHMWRVQ